VQAYSKLKYTFLLFLLHLSAPRSFPFAPFNLAIKQTVFIVLIPTALHIFYLPQILTWTSQQTKVRCTCSYRLFNRAMPHIWLPVAALYPLLLISYYQTFLVAVNWKLTIRNTSNLNSIIVIQTAVYFPHFVKRIRLCLRYHHVCVCVCVYLYQWDYLTKRYSWNLV